MVKTLLFVSILCLAVTALPCNDNSIRNPIPVVGLNPSSMNVIGWYPDWQRDIFPIEKIPFQNLTHINYAFLGINSDGSIDVSNIDIPTLQRLVSLAHGNNTKVWIGVGGAGSGSAYASVTNYTTLVRNILKFVSDYNLDGVDIDWEFPDNAPNQYVTLMRTLYTAAHPTYGVSASIPATDYYGQYILTEAFPYTDWWSIMAYDYTGFWAGSPQNDSSSYSDALGSVQYWIGRGLKPSQIALGVPFYGNNFTSQASITYAEVVLNFDVAPDVNNMGKSWWPSPSVTAEKVVMAASYNVSGIMIWEISQDYRGSCRPSLLDTIAANVPRTSQGSTTGNSATTSGSSTGTDASTGGGGAPITGDSEEGGASKAGMLFGLTVSVLFALVM